jgi:hypothetical protein
VHLEWEAAAEGMKKEEGGATQGGPSSLYMGGKKEGRGGRTFGASVCTTD